MKHGQRLCEMLPLEVYQSNCLNSLRITSRMLGKLEGGALGVEVVDLRHIGKDDDEC